MFIKESTELTLQAISNVVNQPDFIHPHAVWNLHSTRLLAGEAVTVRGGWVARWSGEDAQFMNDASAIYLYSPCGTVAVQPGVDDDEQLLNEWVWAYHVPAGEVVTSCRNLIDLLPPAE